jgi:hypothetical protein
MRKLLISGIAVGLALVFTGCGVPTVAKNDGNTSGTQTEQSGLMVDETSDSSDGSSPGGFGVTYNGKIGIDLGGGIIMPMDGSAPSFGVGF